MIIKPELTTWTVSPQDSTHTVQWEYRPFTGKWAVRVDGETIYRGKNIMTRLVRRQVTVDVAVFELIAVCTTPRSSFLLENFLPIPSDEDIRRGRTT